MDNLPTRKKSITLTYDMSSVAASMLSTSMKQKKKLRRLPHVFCRVLELPLNSDVPIAVEENEECFRFVVSTDVVFEDVSVEVLEIVPGITKVVVRGAKKFRISLNDLELDLLRFRLPSSTLPELSTAVYRDGELVITVPKDMNKSFQEEADNGGLIRVREESMDAGNRDFV